MSKYIIAYDLGTGGNKASLYDEDGVCVTSTFVPYNTIYPDVGWHEQKPMDWWNAIVESTHKLLLSSGIDRNSIKCLAISGHSLGVVPIDKDGNLLREITPIWSDTRAKNQADRFFDSVDEVQWYHTTGNGFSRECYSIFKIMWYHDNEPDLFSQTYKIIGTKDFINFKLTGRIATDYSYASGSGVYDLLSWSYSPDLVKASGIPHEVFPVIVPSTSIIGNVTKEASEITGLPINVQVACGGVDNSCMALGAKNIENGRVYISVGSSAWVAVSAQSPIIDIITKPFTFTHVIPDMYVSSFGIFSAGNSFKWMKDTFFGSEAKTGGSISYDELISLAEQSPVGAKKLMFNPSLAGGSAAHPSSNVRGAYVGLDLSHTINDIVRSTMEGVAYELRMVLDILRRLCSLSDDMLLVGGGSKSSAWRQIFADIFNANIVKTNIGQNAGSLGAAVIAAVGSGLWKSFAIIDSIHQIEDISRPIKDNVKKYQKLVEAYRYSWEFLSKFGDMVTRIDMK
ncbi:MAG: FGGY-family carbohydrate kinase [Spirochaetes bacterium]|nr:FGGY-family carbohydrate kinase [Spirochaetota bacterium]